MPVQLLRDTTDAQEAKKASPLGAAVGQLPMIALEPVSPAPPVAEARQPAPIVVEAAPAVDGAAVETRQNPYVEAAKVSGAVSGAVDGTVEAEYPAREASPTPPAPPAEKPGADYVRAVLSGALAPRPKTAQELFMRTGTTWTPPESEYRLADKTA